ncbi:MAG TPA: sodium/solute symporter, partial [Candidatus Kapabacteria bacterium]|nr:sodium/solute symporter [Candidatus Kapabacteria bacterium]
MHTPEQLDYFVVGVYFVLMICIGVYVARFMRGAKDFFAGGNKIPWWIAGVSLYMQNFSAWTFSGAAGFTYYAGWFAVLYFATWCIGYLVGTQLTAVQWRRSRVISPVEYTQTRFNISTQQLAGWALALNFLLTAGIQLAATCKLLLPILNIDVNVFIIATGAVILIYTYLGGVWAVSITDTAQFAILMCITLLVVPLTLSLVGGLPNLISHIPPLSLSVTYNNFHYDVHWLISFWIILTIGTAQGAAQRFYSVKDERSAKKLGLLCAGLFVTAPLVFSIPPLVARVLWPDLNAEPFFVKFKDLRQPQDLVFVALCMKVLPNGLIGMFAAAMLSSTMSALSGVFNMIASIFTRDVYKSFVNKDATDRQMLTVGRWASALVGTVVVSEAIYFIAAPFGIFNYMQQFFSLFNVPISLPLAFGLLFRKVSRWGAFAATLFGLAIAADAKFLIGWSIGPQVYLTTVMVFGVFYFSDMLGKLYASKKTLLYIVAAAVVGIIEWLFIGCTDKPLAGTGWMLVALPPFVYGAGIIIFAKVFAADLVADRSAVKEFFAKLDTPVDVAKEVFSAGQREQSTAPLIGTILM